MTNTYTYTKPERFAVARKRHESKRHYTNFKVLYTDRADAMTEARRLSETTKADFYVIEIQEIVKKKKIVKVKKEAVVNA